VKNSTCSKNSAAMRSNAKLQNTLAKMAMPVTGEDAIADTSQPVRLVKGTQTIGRIEPSNRNIAWSNRSNLPFATLYKCKCCKHEFDNRREDCPACGESKKRWNTWTRRSNQPVSYRKNPTFTVRISEVK
jgi:hypothetical protein